MGKPLLGDVLRNCREAKNWSLRDLSYMTGISSSLLSRIENHKHWNIDVNTLLKLDRRLKCGGKLVKVGWRTPDYEEIHPEFKPRGGYSNTHP